MIEMKLAVKAVSDVLMEMGIYPKAVIEGGVEKKRTEWQDGWNAAVMKLSGEIKTQLEKLEGGISDDLALLMITDVGWLEGDQFKLNMNDTFWFACADCEMVNKEDIPKVASLFRNFGYKGLTYWVAEKRGYDPEILSYKEEVEEVRKKSKLNCKGGGGDVVRSGKLTDP